MRVGESHESEDSGREAHRPRYWELNPRVVRSARNEGYEKNTSIYMKPSVMFRVIFPLSSDSVLSYLVTWRMPLANTLVGATGPQARRTGAP